MEVFDPRRRGNCNNVAAPAVVGKYVHVGTMAGYYYVLDRDSGAVVKEIDCGEPIFAAPAVGEDRVYFATLGAGSTPSSRTAKSSGPGTS